MRFINTIQNSLLIAIFIFCTSCSKETHEDDIDGEIKTEKFDQGTIEMGTFSQGVDLSKLVGKVDFSHTDPKSQYQTLLKNDKEVQAITNVVEQIAAQNPIAGLALSMNATACTYYIKGDVVLGKVKGLGWEMDNFHDQQQDKGSLYLETLTRTDEIAETDKKIYAQYTPSANPGAGASNAIELSNFNRVALNKQEIINGYLCDVTQLTPKTIDPDAPMNMRKLLVYTSPLFNKTINFTHPFYLQEENGILRLDIYFIDDKTPTLVMKPKNIEQRIVKNDELQSRTAQPIYTELSAEWAFKALPIMMSGWAVLAD
ncbi:MULTISPECIES: hypothetical protein [Sphingobacterium]|uniref:hypothetical protein n=1 Tax=Sphingobacterium TaxID=28453 RepID=UPI0013D93420|nr:MULTISPECIES: hypothetical protein [unclassified Sphingobacterium]